MKTLGSTIALLAAAFSIAAAARAAAPPTNPPTAWVEGRNYFLVQPPRPSSVPAGKIEVTEAFSYACPACNAFLPTMQKLQQTLPANAVITYLPASFNAGEDWPMFQLAYLTAQSLGIADKTHVAMFDAVWGSGELAVIDPATGGIKARVPTIEDAARFYEKQAGVPVAKFLSAAKSMSVDMQVRRAEELLKAYAIDRTPTLIVNGKYRVQVQSAGGPDQLVELVKWLVAKESK
jgi:protein dithiol oxidoreductase (disulfide-forming)